MKLSRRPLTSRQVLDLQIAYICDKEGEIMAKEGENNLQREGLETARCPTGVGSNPTPRTKDEPMRAQSDQTAFGLFAYLDCSSREVKDERFWEGSPKFCHGFESGAVAR